MRLTLDDLDIYFPFKHIYREQVEYLKALKKIFSTSPTNSIIQVPPALSKATCIFAFYVSLYLQNPATIPRLIFSAKSVPEFEHAMTTLKLVIDYIEKEHNIKVPLLALCISEKKNLCINDAVAPKAAREIVNYECNKRIAPWTRQRHKHFANGNQQEIESDPALCRFYEGHMVNQKNTPEVTGCHSLESLKEYGKKHKMCPYYLAEELFPSAQIILCDYFMLFGMKKSNNFDRKILEGAFLVIDECCGLDDSLSEMFTERISRISLDHALKCVEDLNNQLKNIKEINPKRFDEEYEKLVKGMTKDDIDLNQINKKNEKAQLNHFDEGGDEIMNTEKRIKFPGYIRKPEHFITHLKKFILFLKGSITKNTSKIISHVDFLERYLKETLIDSSLLPLAYFPSRMRALINFLQNSEIEGEQFMPLHALLQFAHIFGTFGKGFEVILYSLQEANLDVNEISLMVLSLACLDPAEPFGQITANIGSLLLHTETLTEVDLFADIMDLREHPNLAKQNFVKIDIHSKLKLMPIIVNKGADQIELSTEHARRNDAGVMRNYSNMIVRLSEAVPDGILCMFPNIRSMKHIGLDFYDEILANKLIFAESIDVEECSKSVSGYVQACERGRGGVFMGVMRGHVLGHLNFDNKTAKCVVVFGMPLEYTRPREFLARTRHFKVKKQIQETDYIVYSVMKEVCKPLGKLIRKREDSCVIIFADKRFLQADKVKKLPEWIQKHLVNAPNQGIPSDQASYRAARFYKACENEKDWEKYGEENINKLLNKLDLNK